MSRLERTLAILAAVFAVLAVGVVVSLLLRERARTRG